MSKSKTKKSSKEISRDLQSDGNSHGEWIKGDDSDESNCEKCGENGNVNLDTKAYGPYVREIKGKNKISRPPPVVSNIAEIPEEFLEVQQDLTI